LSFDFADAAGFDSFKFGAGAVGVGEGEADAISFAGVGVGGAGVCARAADAAGSRAAHSRAIVLRVFISIYPVGGRAVRREFTGLGRRPLILLRGCAHEVRRASAGHTHFPAGDRGTAADA
jgi:hypothetical protein